MSAVKLVNKIPVLLILKPGLSSRGKVINELVVVCPSLENPKRILVESYPYHFSKSPLGTTEWKAEHLTSILEGRLLIAFQAKELAANLRIKISKSGLSCKFQSFCLTRLFGRISEDFSPDYDDPLGTYENLLKLMDNLSEKDLQEGLNPLLKSSYLPPNLRLGELEKLPNECGVYFFYGKHDQLLYVGKSIQIRQRVISHFQEDGKNRRESKMCREVHRVDYQTTAGELGALLLESDCIKRLKPRYNIRLRRTDKYFALCLEENEWGYHTCRTISGAKAVDSVLNGEHKNLRLITLFSTKRQLVSHLNSIVKKFTLCKKLIGLETGRGPCFGFQLKKCEGACCQVESVEKYNVRLALALENIRFESWPYVGRIALREKNIATGDLQYHVIDQWRYVGSTDSRKNAVKLRSPFKKEDPVDLDCYKIIKKYLASSKQRLSRSQELFRYRTLELDR